MIGVPGPGPEEFEVSFLGSERRELFETALGALKRDFFSVLRDWSENLDLRLFSPMTGLAATAVGGTDGRRPTVDMKGGDYGGGYYLLE